MMKPITLYANSRNVKERIMNKLQDTLHGSSGHSNHILLQNSIFFSLYCNLFMSVPKYGYAIQLIHKYSYPCLPLNNILGNVSFLSPHLQVSLWDKRRSNFVFPLILNCLQHLKGGYAYHNGRCIQNMLAEVRFLDLGGVFICIQSPCQAYKNTR